MTRSKGTIVRGLIRLLLVLLAALAVAGACCQLKVVSSFRNPVAWTVFKDRVYVLEKANNTVLELEYAAPDESLECTGVFRIEPDDAAHYYMVRKLYSGPRGVVAHSYIYNRKTEDFVGYRFNEYQSFREPPRTILTVLLKNPKQFPEFYYACDPQGEHWFVNNCAGQSNLWRVPPAGGVTVAGDEIPPGVAVTGETNSTLSAWNAINIDAAGRIFITAGAQDLVLEYTPAGGRVRSIGTVGFGNDNLLAPDELSFAAVTNGGPLRLTVASKGNRAWVQFDRDGQYLHTIAPLKAGYPFADILVSAMFKHGPSGRLLTFDLANRCLVICDRNFRALTSFTTRPTCRLCLLVGLAALLAALALVFNRLVASAARVRFTLFFKLLALIMPLLVISALVAGDWARDIMQEYLKKESVWRSANLARAVVNNLSRADLEAIQNPQDRESPAYERTFSLINRIVDVENNIPGTPKWILHKIRGGKFYFGINIWRGPIYEPFIVPADRRMFFRVLEEKTCQSGDFRDEQGEWFSYLSPVTNAAGEVTYVLELYRPTEEIDRAGAKATRKVLEAVGATVLTTIVLVFIFAYITVRPLKRLMQATRIVATGDFDHQIVVKSRDELSDLAGAFNRMLVNLKQYTAELERATAERERVRSELQLAREVQQAIVPKKFPPWPQAENVEICARIEPAREVGGDYYDFFPVGEHRLGVVIADVSGKGVSAGLFMMEVRAILRSSAMNNISAADTLDRLNRLIAPENASCMFVTMFYFICDLATGKIVFCNAGHPPPIRLGGQGAQFLDTKDGQGVSIGIREDALFREAGFCLAAGETLLLYTDGVTDPIDQNEVIFGEERLLQVVAAQAGRTNREICDQVYSAVAAHQQGMDQFDDITLVCFKYLGPRPGG